MFYVLIVLLIAVAAFPFVLERLRVPMNDAARQGAEGSFANLSRGTVHYDWLGPVRGPVAVCVHGLTTPSFVWRGMARGLALMGYRVLVYDHYGRGYSDRPRGRQDRRFFLSQLNELLADQKVENDITLIGYSMGGAIATAFAAENPGRVRQLILIASAGLGAAPTGLARFVVQTPVIGDWLMLATYARRHRAATEEERDLPSTVENIVDRQQDELRYRGFVPAVLSSLRGILSEVQAEDHRKLHVEAVPVLAIWGDADAVIPLSAMGHLAEWSRDARQEVIEGAGHGLTYTHTAEVLQAIRNTLREGLN